LIENEVRHAAHDLAVLAASLLVEAVLHHPNSDVGRQPEVVERKVLNVEPSTLATAVADLANEWLITTQLT
jgi:hypothetical protein